MRTYHIQYATSLCQQPAQKSGLGRFFGGGNRVPGSPISLGVGSANPYASVKFGSTTQRTTEVFDSLNPIWPRQGACIFESKD
jgi:hypothetical protein